MKKNLRRGIVLGLAALMLLGGVLPLAQAVTQLNGLVPGTPSAQSAKAYTALAPEGVGVPVYAFTDASGLTQYRVYGSLEGRNGFFEAELLAPETQGGEYTLTVKGTAPLTDGLERFAVFQAPASRSATLVPTGFQQGNGAGIVYFRNYFDQVEYFIYASQDQLNWQYFHTDGYSRAMRGGLPVLMDSVLTRAKGYQTYLLPEIYRQAQQLPAQYLVTTTNGQAAVVNGATTVIPVNQLPVPTLAPTQRPDSRLPLNQGSYGQLVKEVQRRLNTLGYAAGYADAIYGSQTAAAVSAFQQVNGLTLTGIVDKATYDRMMSSSALPNNATPTPVPTPTPEPVYEGNYNAKVSTSGGDLNLWSIPNPTKRAKYSIAKIPYGTLLEGVEKGNQGFSRVIFMDLTGYVDNNYLDFNVPQPPQ